MSTQFQKIRSIFLDALERPESEWLLFVAEATAGDAELYEQVNLLLEAHVAGTGLLDKATPHPSPTLDRPIMEKPGVKIGPYKLLQLLGEGGMGVVYMAEQKEPVQRRVALKIIKPGMDTRQIIARFEAERQALAMMDHPNIAKVLEAGTTESSRPYFVMELVNGLPVTQYCDEQHLTPRERLELFVPICQAVQHAHQKGVIHRDLKPNNILVAHYDGKPVPKIIDFGVAKATRRSITDKTRFTEIGQIVGTLEYMSPEQAERNQLDIDTRTDIYSLGVVLYELLTGETPFDRQRLRSAAFDEILRIIREEEPSKPSTKVSGSQLLPSIAANRRMEPSRLGAMFRGELDWIVLKAMDKDRVGRYDTASRFADDVVHYLNDEPVTACPPSKSYRFRKFARRHKVAISTAVAITVSLIAGVLGTTWQAYRAMQAEGVAKSRLQIVESQKEEIERKSQQALAESLRAEREAEKARREAEIAKAVNEFLNNDLLGMTPSNQAEAGISPDSNVRLQTLVDRAAKEVESRFSDNPLVEAAIHDTLGATYLALGKYHEAEQQLQRAREIFNRQLGKEAEETLSSQHELAMVFLDQGRFAQAEDLLRSTRELLLERFGKEHSLARDATTTLGIVLNSRGQCDAARDMLEEVLKIQRRELGNDHVDTLRTMNLLAISYLDLDLLSRAEALFLEVLEICQQTREAGHPLIAATKNNLANVYRRKGRLDEAEMLIRDALHINQQARGELHPFSLKIQKHLAVLEADRGHYSEAIELLSTTLQQTQVALGTTHLDTLKAQGSLASMYAATGRSDLAEPLYVESVQALQSTLGDHHPETLSHMDGLAQARRYQGSFEDALELQRRVLDIRRKELGPEHFDTLASMNHLAITCLGLSQYEEAERLFREKLAIVRQKMSDEPELLSECINNLGQVYQARGEYEKAEKLTRESLEILQDAFPDDHPKVLLTLRNLALICGTLGRHAESKKIYRHVLEILKQEQHEDYPLRKFIAADLDSLYLSRARQLIGESDATQQDAEEAVKLTKIALEVDPEHVDGWKFLGWAQFRANRWSESLESLEKSCALQGGGGTCTQWIVMALDHWKLGTETELNDDEQMEHLIAASRLRTRSAEQLPFMMRVLPDNSELIQPILNFSDEANDTIDDSELEMLITRSIEQGLGDISKQEFYEARADARSRQGNYSSAAKDYAHVIDLLPDDEDCMSRRSQFLIYLIRQEAVFDALVGLRPNDPHLHLAQARNLGQQERWDEAADVFLSLDHASQLGLEVCFELGCLLRLTDNHIAWQRHLTRLRERADEVTDPEDLIALARTFCLAKQTSESAEQIIEWASAAVDASATSRSRHALAFALYRAGKYDEALQALGSPTPSDWANGHPQNWILLALIHHQNHQPESARLWLQKADDWFAAARRQAGDGPVPVYAIDWFSVCVLRREAEGIVNALTTNAPPATSGTHQASHPHSDRHAETGEQTETNIEPLGKK